MTHVQVMETVNVEMDLRNFIRHARREVASDAVAVAQAAAAAENEALAAAAAGGGGGGRFGGAGGEARGSLFGDDGEGAMRPTSGTGAGVLSSRADSRGVALAFQRLFGIGQVRRMMSGIELWPWLGCHGWGGARFFFEKPALDKERLLMNALISLCAFCRSRYRRVGLYGRIYRRPQRRSRGARRRRKEKVPWRAGRR